MASWGYLGSQAMQLGRELLGLAPQTSINLVLDETGARPVLQDFLRLWASPDPDTLQAWVFLHQLPVATRKAAASSTCCLHVDKRAVESSQKTSSLLELRWSENITSMELSEDPIKSHKCHKNLIMRSDMRAPQKKLEDYIICCSSEPKKYLDLHKKPFKNMFKKIRPYLCKAKYIYIILI